MVAQAFAQALRAQEFFMLVAAAAAVAALELLVVEMGLVVVLGQHRLHQTQEAAAVAA